MKIKSVSTITVGDIGGEARTQARNLATRSKQSTAVNFLRATDVHKHKCCHCVKLHNSHTKIVALSIWFHFFLTLIWVIRSEK